MAQKIRMCFNEHKELQGIVEIDETFVGGKEINRHENKKLIQGRGAVGKVAVSGVVSCEEK